MIFDQICLNFTNLSEFNDYTLMIQKAVKNMSFYSFLEESEENEESWQIKLLKISIYIILICVALVGNILLLVVFLLNKFLRKPTNYYIFNLAICDLAIVASGMWVQIVTTYSQGGQWLLGKFTSI
jgi:hypothetical protein